MTRVVRALAVVALASAAGGTTARAEPPAEPPAPASPSIPIAREPFPGERHLKNVRQLTNGGENAEAYWSFAGDRVVFQSTRPPYTADQIFTMGVDGSDVRLVSTGKGRTTCAFFLPGDRSVLFASTHLDGDAPPKPPDRSQGYVWGIFSYEIFRVNLDGTGLSRLTESPGYDAEATVSPKGDRIVFTSSRDGDLDVYTMDLEGKDVRRLTNEVGYDGGAVFSPDGSKICWRADHPRDDEGKARFQALLGKGLVRPTNLELMVMSADGSDKRQITRNGRANFAPVFHPDGKRVLFASNLEDATQRSFDLYLVNLDGTGLERVTQFTNDAHDDFDGFPMFSPDGKRLLWCSNRHNAKPHETNVFVADWVD
jgi:Tol biopolymer transport system component